MLGSIAGFKRDLIAVRMVEGFKGQRLKGKHMGSVGKEEKDVRKALKLYAD